MTGKSSHRLTRYLAAPMIGGALIWGVTFSIAGQAGADPKTARPATPGADGAALVPAAPLRVAGQPVATVPQSTATRPAVTAQVPVSAA